MADHHTSFCAALPVTQDSKEWIDKVISTMTEFAEALSKSDAAEELEAELLDLTNKDLVESMKFNNDVGFDLLEEEGRYYIESRDGSVDNAIGFIQSLLAAQCQPETFVTFQWAMTSSRLTPDGNGGGAALITADKVETMTTNAWIEAELEDLPRSSPSA